MKSVVVVILVIVLMGLVASASIGAVDSVDVLIKALIEKQVITEEDAAAVRAEIANIRQDEEAAKKSFPVTTKKPIKLSGYVQERYTHSDQTGVSDTFEPRRVRLLLAGDATDKADFKVQLELAGSRKALTGATLTTTSTPNKLTTTNSTFSKPLLLDAVVGYKLAGDDKLSFGQFKIPFGLENLTSSSATDTINLSQVTEALVPGKDIGSQGYDDGIQLNGTRLTNEANTRQLDYYLGLFNGTGLNVGDDNNHKDRAARLVYKPGIAGLTLGTSFYDGASGATKLSRQRLGGEATYVLGKYTAKAEYVWGKDSATRKEGWYTTLVRNWSPSTQGVIRYDRYDPNVGTANNASGVWTFGFNKFLNKDGYTRWQINYERKREQATQVPNDQLLAQFQVGF